MRGRGISGEEAARVDGPACAIYIIYLLTDPASLPGRKPMTDPSRHLRDADIQTHLDKIATAYRDLARGHAEISSTNTTLADLYVTLADLMTQPSAAKNEAPPKAADDFFVIEDGIPVPPMGRPKT